MCCLRLQIILWEHRVRRKLQSLEKGSSRCRKCREYNFHCISTSLYRDLILKTPSAPLNSRALWNCMKCRRRKTRRLAYVFIWLSCFLAIYDVYHSCQVCMLMLIPSRVEVANNGPFRLLFSTNKFFFRKAKLAWQSLCWFNLITDTIDELHSRTLRNYGLASIFVLGLLFHLQCVL